MKVKPEPKIARRAVAAIIDYGIYLGITSIYVVMFGEPDDEGKYTVHNWLALVPIFYWILYFPLIESLSGKTFGKYLLDLKVVTRAGKDISFIQSFKRHILDWLDLGTFGLTSLISVQNSDYRQRPADFWANTTVIGGESVLCPNCRDSISLSPNEIMKSQFDCPACSQHVTL